jgi:hypothetical protein
MYEARRADGIDALSPQLRADVPAGKNLGGEHAPVEREPHPGMPVEACLDGAGSAGGGDQRQSEGERAGDANRHTGQATGASPITLSRRSRAFAANARVSSRSVPNSCVSPSTYHLGLSTASAIGATSASVRVIASP